MKKNKKNLSGDVWCVDGEAMRSSGVDEIVLGVSNPAANPVVFRTYIKQVKYCGPATIIFWEDGTKTISKCSPRDEFDPEKGFCIAYMKKVVGSDEVRSLLRDWVPETYYIDNLLDSFGDTAGDWTPAPRINETIKIADVRKRNNS